MINPEELQELDGKDERGKQTNRPKRIFQFLKLWISGRIDIREIPLIKRTLRLIKPFIDLKEKIDGNPIGRLFLKSSGLLAGKLPMAFAFTISVGVVSYTTIVITDDIAFLPGEVISKGGQDGAQGPAGFPGDPGSLGLTGDPGPAGLTGDPGKPGVAGKDGIDGDSQWPISNNNTYYTGGNVGIGITDPRRDLHIKDVMRLEPRTSFPTSPAVGDLFVLRVGDVAILCFFTGRSWAAAAATATLTGTSSANLTDTATTIVGRKAGVAPKVALTISVTGSATAAPITASVPTACRIPN